MNIFLETPLPPGNGAPVHRTDLAGGNGVKNGSDGMNFNSGTDGALGEAPASQAGALHGTETPARVCGGVS
jgi:hypothetical protein